MSTTYKLNGDSHMMKNMEWGAVAYLSHSKYGTCTDGTCVEIGMNNNNSYITGCGAEVGSGSSDICNAYNSNLGMKASTTGNIYGVYDMNGGSWDYVMGNMVNIDGNFNSSDSGFINLVENKYIDSYSYDDNLDIDGRNFNGNRRKLGDATNETVIESSSYLGGWYSDVMVFPGKNISWYARGGSKNSKFGAGIFGLYNSVGGIIDNSSARSILVK